MTDRPIPPHDLAFAHFDPWCRGDVWFVVPVHVFDPTNLRVNVVRAREPRDFVKEHH